MSPNPTAEYDEILARVRTWPPQQRLHLAEDLLRSLPRASDPDGLRGVPVEKVRGVAAGVGPVPDDETVSRWVEEHHLDLIITRDPRGFAHSPLPGSTPGDLVAQLPGPLTP